MQMDIENVYADFIFCFAREWNIMIFPIYKNIATYTYVYMFSYVTLSELTVP